MNKKDHPKEKDNRPAEKGKTETPAACAGRAIAELEKLADPAKAAGVQKYFKGTIESFGVSSPETRRMAADIYASVKGKWEVADAVALCEILFRRPELEAKGVGICVIERFRGKFDPGFLAVVKDWLERDLLDNWASVDVLCTKSLGALLLAHPELVEEVKGWAFHPGLWVKRASAVSFIKLARRPEYMPAVYEIAASLFPVEEDLLHKAVGWLLREAGKGDAGRLERFLLEHGPAIPRTTLRYAIERFPEEKRKALLAKTRK